METFSSVLKNAFLLVTLIPLSLAGIDAAMGQTIQIERSPNREIEIPEASESTLSMYPQTPIQSGIKRDRFYLFPVKERRHAAISIPDDSFCHSTWWAYCRNEISPDARTELHIEYDPEDSLGIILVSEDARKLYYELFQKDGNRIRIPNHVRYNIALRSLGESPRKNKRSILISTPATRLMWKGVDSILRMFVPKSSRFKRRPL